MALITGSLPQHHTHTGSVNWYIVILSIVIVFVFRCRRAKNKPTDKAAGCGWKSMADTLQKA